MILTLPKNIWQTLRYCAFYKLWISLALKSCLNKCQTKKVKIIMTTTTPEPEIGTGKTIFVIAVVLGCFAVLYPKIFYHMMFDEKKDKPTGKQKLNNNFFYKIKIL